MPLNKHFKGHGEEVMESMKKTYKDPATAERVFYATENKEKNESKTKKSMKAAMKKKASC
jgi:hypothetical protein